MSKFGNYKMKMRAYLLQIYHHALHNRVAEAKNILLKMHIGEMIHVQDVALQILYNRAVIQIGMAYFRLGQVEQSHGVLVEVTQNPRLKESLAQGISKMVEKPLELEKEEAKRQVPFHRWINLQQLDCVYMISSMLIDVPNSAEGQF